ncbi:MAG TPA: mandelate racemase/muconate lactonizing enzyme family protein [Bryobacteraceae bacterium]|nr:mandelate racemase/muconate lactonizing enzyme family protein [Bryobacteraceae bacterium]
MSDLEITALEVYPLREPVSRRAYTVVRLRTRSGLEGFGECRAASPAEVARARQLVAGRPATAFEVLRRELAPLPAMQSAVNMALLDLVGKFSRAPLFQVLGGPTRNRVRALAPLAGSTDAALAASLERARAAGFRAVAVPLPPPAARNQGQAFVLAARRRLEALRTAAANLDFVLDAGAALSPGDASVLAAALERFHLLWFDEPCRLFNLDAVRKISSESVTPLGFGRSLREAAGYQELLRNDAVDILRPDLAAHGVTQIRRIAAMAETYYMAVAPYHDGGPVATAAALHLAASLPNFFIQQFPFPEAEEDRRMRGELTGTPVETVRDGYAPLPTGPGLGIEVRTEVLEKYRERAA